MTREVPSLPPLHVLLGGGGVGKTTLAAALAIALARSGRRVGLLTIDPAHRLQTALGLPYLGEEPIPVAGVTLDNDARAGGARGVVLAASLHPAESLRRWAHAALPDEDARARLTSNPFFLALADRLAGAADTIAAIRLAEWAESDPTLDALVVDTAPGAQAIDFLARPDRMLAFLEGRLVRWVKWSGLGAAGEEGLPGRLVRGQARRGLGPLTRLGGSRMLAWFADFLRLADAALAVMSARLQVARRWLRGPTTGLLLVAAPRQDAARAVSELASALEGLRLPVRAAILNRALPRALGAALESLDERTIPEAAARSFVRLGRNSLHLQEKVHAALVAHGLPVIELPDASRLDDGGAGRLEALAALGQRLAAGLR